MTTVLDGKIGEGEEERRAERNLIPSEAYVCAAVVDAEGESSVRYPTCVPNPPEKATAGMPSFAPSTAAPLYGFDRK